MLENLRLLQPVTGCAALRYRAVSPNSKGWPSFDRTCTALNLHCSQQGPFGHILATQGTKSPGLKRTKQTQPNLIARALLSTSHPATTATMAATPPASPRRDGPPDPRGVHQGLPLKDIGRLTTANARDLRRLYAVESKEMVLEQLPALDHFQTSLVTVGVFGGGFTFSTVRLPFLIACNERGKDNRSSASPPLSQTTATSLSCSPSLSSATASACSAASTPA
jgi:hypothetical protein